MVDKRPALGRGLSALIPDAPPAPPPSPAAPAVTDRALEIDIDLLRPNKYQPRVRVDDAKIDELARSIRTNGIIQPIVVRKVDGDYEIVAGERRCRRLVAVLFAARRLGTPGRRYCSLNLLVQVGADFFKQLVGRLPVAWRRFDFELGRFVIAKVLCQSATNAQYLHGCYCSA